MKQNTYRKYKSRILKFAKQNLVKILFFHEPEGGLNYYWHKTKTSRCLVVIESWQPNCDKICSLLHELGHFIQYKRRGTKARKAYRSKNFEERLPLTKKQKNTILKNEIAAWKNAEALAILLNIPLSCWFFGLKRSSLSTYKHWPIKKSKRKKQNS